MTMVMEEETANNMAPDAFTEDSDGDSTFRPRSYVLTNGRTKPAVDLPIETLLVPTGKGIKNANRLTVENQKIVEICSRSSQSIAEISAHLKLPLGVARVLAGDLVAHGLMKATVPTYHSDNKQRLDRSILERVLEGLEGL
jgi:hypothetical protein